jgi:hypothetical protein
MEFPHFVITADGTSAAKQLPIRPPKEPRYVNFWARGATFGGATISFLICDTEDGDYIPAGPTFTAQRMKTDVIKPGTWFKVVCAGKTGDDVITVDIEQ